MNTTWQNRAACVTVAILMLASGAFADEFYVSPLATPWLGDGSIGNPYGTLELALNAAKALPGDHTIWLQPGTYTGGSRANDPFFHAGLDRGSVGADFFVEGVLSFREAPNNYNTITISSVDSRTNTTISSEGASQPVDAHGFFYHDQATSSTNIIFEDLTLDVDSSVGGRYEWLIGYVGAGKLVGITFRQCDVIVGDRSIFKLDPNDIQGNMLLFEESNLYLAPRGDNRNIFVGNNNLNREPGTNLVHGDMFSSFYWWNGLAYVKTNDLTMIQSADSDGDTWGNATFNFVTGFEGVERDPPPPTGLLLMVR